MVLVLFSNLTNFIFYVVIKFWIDFALFLSYFTTFIFSWSSIEMAQSSKCVALYLFVLCTLYFICAYARSVHCLLTLRFSLSELLFIVFGLELWFLFAVLVLLLLRLYERCFGINVLYAFSTISKYIVPSTVILSICKPAPWWGILRLNANEPNKNIQSRCSIVDSLWLSDSMVWMGRMDVDVASASVAIAIAAIGIAFTIVTVHTRHTFLCIYGTPYSCGTRKIFH